MSTLKSRQVDAFLRKYFFEHIDVSDLKKPLDENRFTRSLAAFALATSTGLTFRDACQKVVDGSGDGGIDAFHYDRVSLTFHIVQSKWSLAGQKTISAGDIHKLFEGLTQCLENDSGSFNSRIKSRWSEIEEAAEKAEKVAVKVVYNSDNDLSAEVKKVISKSLSRLTAGDETVSVITIRSAMIWQLIKEYQKRTGDRGRS